MRRFAVALVIAVLFAASLVAQSVFIFPGGGTFGGNVDVAGNLTLSGSITAGGGGAGDFTASATGAFGGVSRALFATPTDGEMNLLNNGGTANGALRYGRAVEANTTTKTPALTECGEVYTNTGDGDGSAVTLPNDPQAGCFYTIAATAAQTITITANTGESLRSGTSTCGTSLTMNSVASNVTIMALTGGNGAIWAVIAVAGTATCNA